MGETGKMEEESIVWKRPPFVDWTKYGDRLSVDLGVDSTRDDDDEKTTFQMNAGAAEFIPMAARRPTSSLLGERIQDVLDSDPAYGVGGAMACASRWIEWATRLAENYPERTKHVAEECRKDCGANKSVLNSLKSDTRDGYSGSIVYIHALNYTLQDSFARCSLPLPPGMNLKRAVELRGREPPYKSQMCAWLGYQSRVFRVIEAINGTSIVSNHWMRPSLIYCQRSKEDP
jgi:hypothetical protein